MRISYRKTRTGRKGYSLLEVIIAASLSSLVMIAVMFLWIYLQKVAMAGWQKTEVKRDVNYVLEYMAHKIRNSSRDYGLMFDQEVDGYPGQYHIVVFHISEEQVQALYFHPNSKEVRLIPDIASNAYQVIGENIADCRFYVDPPVDKNELEIEIVGEIIYQGKSYSHAAYVSATQRAP